MELGDYAKMYVPMRAAARRAMDNFSRRRYQRQPGRKVGVNKMYRPRKKSVFNVENHHRTLWSSSINRCVTHFSLPSPIKKSALSLGIRSSFPKGGDEILENLAVFKNEPDDDYASELLVIKEEPPSTPEDSLLMKYEVSSDELLSPTVLPSMVEESVATVVKQEPDDEYYLPVAYETDDSRFIRSSICGPTLCGRQDECADGHNMGDSMFGDIDDDSLLRDVARIMQLNRAIALIKAYLVLSDCPCDSKDCIGAAYRRFLQKEFAR